MHEAMIRVQQLEPRKVLPESEQRAMKCKLAPMVQGAELGKNFLVAYVVDTVTQLIRGEEKWLPVSIELSLAPTDHSSAASRRCSRAVLNALKLATTMLAKDEISAQR